MEIDTIHFDSETELVRTSREYVLDRFEWTSINPRVFALCGDGAWVHLASSLLEKGRGRKTDSTVSRRLQCLDYRRRERGKRVTG
jgi:hypothetical protein